MDDPTWKIGEKRPFDPYETIDHIRGLLLTELRPEDEEKIRVCLDVLWAYIAGMER